ncbi:MAG: 4'-phosphopantetheinyl transferase family protein [Magnetospiraceae bacterium]
MITVKPISKIGVSKFRANTYGILVVHTGANRFLGYGSYLDGWLSPQDRGDIARVIDPETRAAMRVGRALPGLILARLLDVSKETIRIIREDRHKPKVVIGGASGIDFSVTRSKNFVGLAVGNGLELGFDAETLRSYPDSLDLAKRYFNAKEAEWIAAADGAERENRFFSVWTKKEAVVKALGTGLSTDLATFRVPGPQTGAVTWMPPEKKDEKLSVGNLSIAPEIIAALCASNIPTPIELLDLWPEHVFV